MKGKYITTGIMMAVLSGSKKVMANKTKETVASLSDHQLIWSKGVRTTNTTPTKAKREAATC